MNIETCCSCLIKDDFVNIPLEVKISDGDAHLAEKLFNEDHLHEYAKDPRNTELLKQMLDRGLVKNTNKVDKFGATALHYAARCHNWVAFQLLVAYNKNNNTTDIHVRDKNKSTILHYAARKKETARTEDACNIVSHLVKNGLKSDEFDDSGYSVLHLCAMKGNVHIAKIFFEEMDLETAIEIVDIRDKWEKTPLHLAAMYDFCDMAKLLLDHAASAMARDSEDVTPIHLASMRGNLAMLDLLMKRVDDPIHYMSRRDKSGKDCLDYAVENRNIAVVERLLELGASVNESGFGGFGGLGVRATCGINSPIHLAAISGNMRLVDILLEQNADVTALGKQRATPLHRAAEYKHFEIAEKLLSYNREMLISTDFHLCTPLLYAVRSGDAAIVDKFLKAGANAEEADDKDNTSVIIAARHNHYSVLKILLDHHKVTKEERHVNLLNGANTHGNTALHKAAKYDHMKVLQILLAEKEVERSPRNDKEMSPFHLAALNGHVEICSKLISETEGQCLHDMDENSETALHMAVRRNHLKVVELLVANGADKEARNMDLLCPLDIAAIVGHCDILDYLISKGAIIDFAAITDKKTALQHATIHNQLRAVNLLIQQGADVAFINTEGKNAMVYAIENGHVRVATAIIQSSHWRESLLIDLHYAGGARDTPMRMLIRSMSEVAKLVLDKCTHIVKAIPPTTKNDDTDNKSENDSEDSTSKEDIKDHKENVSNEVEEESYTEYNFELLDDTYSTWNETSYDGNFNSQKYGFDEVTQMANYWKEPYTQDKVLLKDNHPLTLMVKYQQESLLKHGLVQALIESKWNFAKDFYYPFLALNGCFLISLTLYGTVARVPVPDDIRPDLGPVYTNDSVCAPINTQRSASWPALENRIAPLVWCLATTLLLFEIAELLKTRLRYLKDPVNLLDIFCYVSAIAFTWNVSECGIREVWQWELGAFSVLFSWFNFMLLFQRVPVFGGIYVCVIVEILKTFTRLVVVFSLILMAFAFSMYMLLQNQVSYRNPFYAFVKTWVSMIGELDYGNIYQENFEATQNTETSKQLFFSRSSYAIFFLFLVLGSIIVNNLLIALAVGDVNAMRDVAELKKLSMVVELSLDIEYALEGVWRKLHWSRVIRSTRIVDSVDCWEICKRIMTEPLKDLQESASTLEENDRTMHQLGTEELEKKLGARLDNLMEKVNKLDGLAEQISGLEKLIINLKKQT